MAKTKTALEPDKIQALLTRGGSEAAAGPGRHSSKETPRPERPTRVVKEAVTIRLSHELMLTLHHKQGDLRSAPGARRGDTTIGGVIESLLRQALKMESL
jgi:hypothetical protein